MKMFKVTWRYSKICAIYVFFFNLSANVQLVKLGIVTAVIYYYITSEFHYAKHDSDSVWRYLE